MTSLESQILEEAKKAGPRGVHFKALCKAVEPECIGEFLDTLAKLNQQGKTKLVGKDLRIASNELEG